MSQRLLSKTLDTDVMPVHPRTGLLALALSPAGQPIWSVRGGDGEDDDDDDDDDTSGGGGSDDDGAKGSGSSGDDDKGKGENDKDDKGDARIKALSDEAAKYRRERNEARTALQDLQNRLEALENKDKPEQERVAQKVTTLESENQSLKEALQQARLNNAFLSSNEFQWHDPEDALRLADLSDVEVDEDGKVTGLKEALKDLAKRKPHLVKKASSASDKDKGDDDKGGNASGHNPNGRKGDKSNLDRERLRKKYPALRR